VGAVGRRPLGSRPARTAARLNRGVRGVARNPPSAGLTGAWAGAVRTLDHRVFPVKRPGQWALPLANARPRRGGRPARTPLASRKSRSMQSSNWRYRLDFMGWPTCHPSQNRQWYGRTVPPARRTRLRAAPRASPRDVNRTFPRHERCSNQVVALDAAEATTIPSTITANSPRLSEVPVDLL
jgi:hypothetical protein